VTEFSLFVLVVAFVALCAASLINFGIKRRKGRTWDEHFPHLVRSVIVRLAIAAVGAVSVFVLITAGLVLNSHRPPGDNSPVIRLDGNTGAAHVEIEMDDCTDPVSGRIEVGPGPRQIEIYTDGEGVRRVRVDRSGVAFFELDDVVAKRGLLSCFAQLPMIRGGAGPTTAALTVGDEMEVDIASSVPIPDTYAGGRWEWRCEDGGYCPVLATVNYAIEDGTKQVIVLVLASLFGSIIALFIGEGLIEPVRRRLNRERPD